MNNDTKLKTILKNVINHCDGITFYKVELDGQMCDMFKSGNHYIIESPLSGCRIDVDTIYNVNFDNDVFYATFNAPGIYHEVGVNIMKDMSPEDIIAELG